VLLPIQLRFERLLRIIWRAIPAHHHEEFLTTFTLEADQIPTLHQPEIPQIPGRCKGRMVSLTTGIESLSRRWRLALVAVFAFQAPVGAWS
jgi:hypothetical protein